MIIHRFTVVTAVCTVAIAAAMLEAHGPQIQIGVESSRIVTRQLFLDEPYEPATPGQRLYEIPLAQRSLADARDGWYMQPNSAYPFTGPGIAPQAGQFATGSILTLTFVDGLKIWGGTDFVDPGTEQFDAYRGANRTAGAITSDSGPFSSFSFTAITNAAGEHKTAYGRLLGDGIAPNTLSDDGVYLVGLQLSTSEAGVSPSLPYYFLLSKNASTADQAAARAYVETYVIPEPASGLLVLVGVLMLGRRRRAARR